MIRPVWNFKTTEDENEGFFLASSAVEEGSLYIEVNPKTKKTDDKYTLLVACGDEQQEILIYKGSHGTYVIGEPFQDRELTFATYDMVRNIKYDKMPNSIFYILTPLNYEAFLELAFEEGVTILGKHKEK